MQTYCAIAWSDRAQSLSIHLAPELPRRVFPGKDSSDVRNGDPR